MYKETLSRKTAEIAKNIKSEALRGKKYLKVLALPMVLLLCGHFGYDVWQSGAPARQQMDDFLKIDYACNQWSDGKINATVKATGEPISASMNFIPYRNHGGGPRDLVDSKGRRWENANPLSTNSVLDINSDQYWRELGILETKATLCKENLHTR